MLLPGLDMITNYHMSTLDQPKKIQRDAYHMLEVWNLLKSIIHLLLGLETRAFQAQFFGA